MKKALVIQGARFGDLVQSKRLIVSLFCNYEVHILVDNKLAELAEYLYPKAIVHGLPFHAHSQISNMAENKAVFSCLAKQDFHKVFNCNFPPLTACICRLFDDDKVVSYRPANKSDGGILRSNWARIVFRLTKNRLANPLNLADFWAWMTKNPVKPDLVNPAAKGGGKGLGIVISGRNARRSLPAPVYANIASAIFSIMKNPDVRLFGTEAEMPQALKILKHCTPAMQQSTKNLCGKTGWKSLISELNGLDLLLAPDTGVMHLAAHLGVPVMAFFLSSAWCHETAPYGAGHIVWQSMPNCAPCLESASCTKNLQCLNVYSQDIFPKFLKAAILKDTQTLLNLPENLLCYNTEFDSFGARLALSGGKDAYADQRAFLRSILKNHFRIEDADFSAITSSEQALLANELEPSLEWMLSSARYY